MGQDIKCYFERTIVPLIEEEHPEVASEMAVQIRGSFGLGIADEFSDLDAVVFLEGALWKAHGGQLQLTLEHRAPGFAKTVGHPEICVWPLSWLLDGHHGHFLGADTDLPWEKVPIEALYEIQENLVLRDPRRIFCRLREATAPERFPQRLWKKLLIVTLKRLDHEGLAEYRQVVRRGRIFESQIMLARVLQDLLRLGFIINRQYYPWRTHLRWAFERLPAVASDVLPFVEAALYCADWNAKVASIEAIRDIYHGYLRKKKVLAPEILDDVEWAERCEAWSNPNWRDRIVECKEKAREAGYDSRDGWIWSLWSWV